MLGRQMSCSSSHCVVLLQIQRSQSLTYSLKFMESLGRSKYKQDHLAKNGKGD
jgi:hypothetical protein